MSATCRRCSRRRRRPTVANCPHRCWFRVARPWTTGCATGRSRSSCNTDVSITWYCRSAAETRSASSPARARPPSAPTSRSARWRMLTARCRSCSGPTKRYQAHRPRWSTRNAIWPPGSRPVSYRCRKYSAAPARPHRAWTGTPPTACIRATTSPC